MSEILKYCKRIEPVGSRVSCNPPPMDTDEDFLVLVDEKNFEDTVYSLITSGWELGGSDVCPVEEDNLVDLYGFNSLKKQSPSGHIVNFIITCSEEFFDKFMEATAICKEQNLLSKVERIKVFQKILYNNDSWADPYECYKDLEMEF